ncbi:UDP-glycosyltransferase 88B1-like [Hordeum vulgare subsp. vulgare]|uniref:Glycosyltransferase n=1 Tax=Hordeum vulgare subsp. vulgare TaxID=112509 RepID=A0A8I6XAL6_HORVV|nr:UDP-glycosyltransferase 88B1-like [Hordeum vulgare subsp. vulgare]
MDGTMTISARKPRVMLYSSPLIGHLVSMIELAKLFAARGLSVTVVLMDPPYDTGATGPFLAGVSAANPSITFHRLPKVKLLDSDHSMMPALAVARLSNPHLHDFLAGASPEVLVLDLFCSAAMDVAKELGIPAYFFNTSGAQILAFFLHLRVLHGKSTRSFREMGQELVHVPGITSFPATHSIQPLMDRDGATYNALLNVSLNLFRSQGIIVNTFRSLEPRAMDTILAGLSAPAGLSTPPVYCIGPLIKSEEVGVKRGHECLAWLDAQPKASVVFLCFGSLGRFSARQTMEVATGLEASGQRFLWVVRSPPGGDDTTTTTTEPDLDMLLPQGFLDRTKGRGLVVKSWAPQGDVLAHHAVGCFVTHCGWNSVLESIMVGVPMVAWPLYAEQRLNAVFLEKEMELAVTMKGYDKEVVEAEEVAKKVRWMMDSEGGRVLRERTLAVMRRAKEALLEGGESEATLAGLVDAWIHA